MNRPEIKPEDFTRVNSCKYGNPRYVIHFLKLVSNEERKRAENMGPEFLQWKYEMALKRSRKFGGRKYNNKQYGGGIVFRSVYNLREFADQLNNLFK